MFLGVASCSLAGCLAVPPIQWVGGVARTGGSASRAPYAATGAISVRPLGLFEKLRDRSVDVGVGATGLYEIGTTLRPDRNLVVGPSTALDMHPLVEPLGGPDRFRLVSGFDVGALYSPRTDSWGPNVGYRVGAELLTEVSGCDAELSHEGAFVGCGQGEGGVGLFATSSFGELDGAARYAFGLALSLRTPGGVVAGLPFDW